MLLSLMIFGPVLWAMTAPAVITGASELAYRAWPYLFLGVAIYGALALRAIDRLARVPLVARRCASSRRWFWWWPAASSSATTRAAGSRSRSPRRQPARRPSPLT